MKSILAVLILSITSSSFCQIGTLDIPFNPNDLGDIGSITSTVQLSNGQILVAGFYSPTPNDPEQQFIKRLNQDGSVDATFNNPLFTKSSMSISTFGVLDLAVDDLDRIYAVGYFDSVHTSSLAGNILRRGIVRFYSNGLIDPGFSPSNSTYYIQTVELQNDGKVLIGGTFSNFGGAPNTTYMARLEQDGTLDNTFQSKFSVTGQGVWDIEVTSDDKILAVGFFNSYDNQTLPNIVRLELDGTLDNSFDVGTGLGNYGMFIEELEDGSYFTGGAFSAYNDTIVSLCVNLNTNGTIKNIFEHPELNGSASNSNLVSFSRDSEGNFYCVGSVQNYLYPYGGLSVSIVRWNPVGELDTIFGNHTVVSGIANTIEYTSDNKLLIGGNIIEYNYYSGVDRLIRVNLNCADYAYIEESPQFTLTAQGYAYYANIAPEYQWYNCTTDELIVGEDQISYLATANSDFSVILTDKYCTDTLNCFSITELSVAEMDNDLSLSVFPNPTSNQIEINGINTSEPFHVRLIDLQGKLILTSNSKIVNLNGIKSGTYLIEVNHDQKQSLLRFVIE